MGTFGLIFAGTFFGIFIMAVCLPKTKVIYRTTRTTKTTNDNYNDNYSYTESVAGAIEIVYPDGYTYNKSVCGEVTIKGPNGYYYNKSTSGNITEVGIFNSKYEMGSKI